MNGANPRGNQFPQRPGQENGYGGAHGGNGTKAENTNSRSYGSATPRTGGSQEPNGRIVLEGYRKDIVNGFETENPRFNTVSRNR